MEDRKVSGMTTKLVGILLVGLSFGVIGFYLASNVKKEINYLHDFIGILDYIECELNFRLTPLPYLCDSAAKKGKLLSSIFSSLAYELNNQIFPDTVRCMEAAVKKHQGIPLIIHELLMDFGYTLGKFDLHGQLISLNAIKQKCESLLFEREKNKHNRVRYYQTLGLCAGMIITILLL